MTVSIPEYVLAEANVEMWFVPAIANPAAPTVAEITAGQRIACYLPTSWAGMTAQQSKTQKSRMCTVESWEVLGKVQRSIADLTYTYVPQSLGTSGGDGNEVYEALAEKNTGFLAVRYGLAAATAPIAAQVFDITPAEAGAQNKDLPTDDAAELTVTQTIGATGPTIPDVKLVA